MLDLTNAKHLMRGGLPVQGKHAFITRDGGALKEACSRYGRDVEKTCLKVFYANHLTENQTLNDALWGDNPRTEREIRKNTTLVAGTQIQNILWKHGISPRVYAVFEATLNGQRVGCQLTEFMEGKATEEISDCYKVYANVNELGKTYGFKALKDILNYEDIINGKFVDPQPFAFDLAPYLDYVKKTYCEEGRYGKVYYQREPRIGLTGAPRQSDNRVRYMRLDKIDFRGKVVWDVGCATGYFCRYASEHGAKRVVGLDMEKPVEAAFHVGNYLKHFNIDYLACDLKRGIPDDDIPRADVAFFLSMNMHIGIPRQLLETVDTVIFEDNGRESRNYDKLGEPWIRYYKDIDFVGRAKDHGDKACYILRR